MTTDFRSTFDDRSRMKVVGYDMSAAAARQVYEQAGLGRTMWTWWSCTTASPSTS